MRNDSTVAKKPKSPAFKYIVIVAVLFLLQLIIPITFLLIVSFFPDFLPSELEQSTEYRLYIDDGESEVENRV